VGGDGAGLAEEREVIQRPRRRPEGRMRDGGGGDGHLRGVYVSYRPGRTDSVVSRNFEPPLIINAVLESACGRDGYVRHTGRGTRSNLAAL